MTCMQNLRNLMFFYTICFMLEVRLATHFRFVCFKTWVVTRTRSEIKFVCYFPFFLRQGLRYPETGSVANVDLSVC